MANCELAPIPLWMMDSGTPYPHEMMANQAKPGVTRRWWIVGLIAYALAIVGIVAFVLQVRSAALREMDTPEARAEWQRWRESKPNQDVDGPVVRQPPKVAEPPALVLLRDHFAVVMSGAVLFGSLLFCALAMAAWGAFVRPAPQPVAENDARDQVH